MDESPRALPPPATEAPEVEVIVPPVNDNDDPWHALGDFFGQRAERIDGVSVFETAMHDVMLDVAYTPVIRHSLGRDPGDEPWLDDLPQPVAVQRDTRGRYCIIDPPRDVGDWHRKRPLMTSGSWTFLQEDQLKIMRARYLLLRGWLYKRLHILPYSQRQAALAWFFPAGVWAPAAGSDLARNMGFK